MAAMHGIVETTTFAREAEAVLDAQVIDDLKEFIARNPESGVVVPGTNGVRKLRWSASGRGKRGGGRVIYYFHDSEAPIFLFRFFTKAAKSDLSPDEKVKLSKVVDGIKSELRRKR